MPETIEVPILDLAILIMALDDHQLDSLTPREEGALENLRDRLAML
jgi:hypothetical protein